ncbi:MAG: hypothetical protein U0794_12010 [Isosphaeraceae bacterium]
MKFLSRDTKAKRAYRPSFDHCEERVVMTLPGLGVVAKNMVGSMSRALVDHGKDQLAGQVFGAVLGVFGIDDGSNQLEFDRINEKLDTIQVDINTIKDDVASLKDSAAIAALDSITKQLKLATIDSLWRDFEALEENMASNPKRDKSIPPTNSVETAALATRITNELHSIVDTFSHAWLGKPSQALGVTLNKPLMKAFSDVLVGRVGVSKTNTAPSTPFLTSK